MSIESSIIIPISNSFDGIRLASLVIDSEILEGVIEKRMIRQRTVKKMYLFKSLVNEEVVVSEGSSDEMIKGSIAKIYKGDSRYAILGTLKPSVIVELGDCLKKYGDTLDWSPCELALSNGYQARWGEDAWNTSAKCLEIRGYGNPVGDGIDYIGGVVDCQVIHKLIDMAGCQELDIISNSCVNNYKNRTVGFNLSC